MKKIFNSKIFIFLLGALISSATLVVASNIQASNVSYSNTTVDRALDNLYTTQSTTVTNLQNENSMLSSSNTNLLGLNAALTQENESLQSQLDNLTNDVSSHSLYVGMFSGSFSINKTEKVVPNVYLDNDYGYINNNNELVITEGGNYQIIGVVSHSPYDSSYTSYLNIYLDNELLKQSSSDTSSAANNYLEYRIFNNDVVINKNSKLKFITLSQSNLTGVAGVTVIIIKK